MAVIKHQLADRFTKDAIVLDMGDLRRQADRLREAAESHAKKIVADANAKAAEVLQTAEADARKRGHEQGLKQGLEQGMEQGRKSGHAEALAKTQAQLQQIQQGWLAAAQAWDAQRMQMDRDARDVILRLALLFAEKVVHRVIAVDSGVIVNQLSQAIQYVMRPADVTVQIHPDDRSALEDAMPLLLAGLPHLIHVRLADDPAVFRGGCVLAYGQGRIDVTVETQLRRLVELIAPDQVAVAPAGIEAAAPTGSAEGGAVEPAPFARE
jgi:flagellar assembly protein FliH